MGEEYLRGLEFPLGMYWNGETGKSGSEPREDAHHHLKRTKETVYTVQHEISSSVKRHPLRRSSSQTPAVNAYVFFTSLKHGTTPN